MRSLKRARLLAVLAVAAASVLGAQAITDRLAAQTADPTTTVAPDPSTTTPPVTTTIPVVITTVPPAATTTPPVSIVVPTGPPPSLIGAPAPVVLAPPTEEPTTTATPDESITTTPESTTTTETSTTTTIQVALGDATADDATSEAPPPAFKPVLPGIAKPVRNLTLEKLLFKLTVEQRKIVADAQATADAASLKVSAAESDLETLSERADTIRAAQARLRASLEQLRVTIRNRSLRIYAGEQIAVLDKILRSQDVTALAREIDLVSQAQQNDADLIKQYEAQQKDLDEQSKELESLSAQKQAQLDTLRVEQQRVAESLLKVQKELASVSNGTAIALGGFVFPVAGPVSFVDTFGAPRMVGTKYFHYHEGTDVFATGGTPLVAVNRGVIAKKGVGVLGGNKLWLVAADGTQYYYAHLSAFVDGVDDGTVVEAGQVIGYVGNTGNAITTPTHLHFEIHPGGGAAINPYPVLDAVRRSDIGALLKATTIATTTTIPGQFRAGVGVDSEFAIEASDDATSSTTVVATPVTRKG